MKHEFKKDQEVWYFQTCKDDHLIIPTIAICCDLIERIDFEMLQTRDCVLVNPYYAYKTKNEALDAAINYFEILRDGQENCSES